MSTILCISEQKQNTYDVSAGNGGIYGDHCGSNGYIQSEHTIGINSVNAMGGRANYGEQCAAIAASVYVSAQPVANDDTLNAIYDDELLIAMAIFESSNGTVLAFSIREDETLFASHKSSNTRTIVFALRHLYFEALVTSDF